MPPRPRPSHLSRRRFLRLSAAAGAAVAVANCRPPGDSPKANSGGSARPLHIYTWADYVDDEVFDRFTQATGTPVEVQTYDSNETMLTKMQAGGGQQFSILYPSDYMVQQMAGLGLLLSLDHTQLKSLDDLRDPWRSPIYDPNNAHSIPLSWGTTGLIYDSTKLNPPPTDWAYLWEQQAALTGRLTLLDDVRETLGATLASLGYSYNTTNPQHIEAAFKRLQELKPAIAQFSSFGWEDQLIAGDLDLCMTYSHLGNTLPAQHPHLQYIIPSSGTSLWTDTMVIPKDAPNPEAAYAWLNFMMQPENAAFAVERLRFATPSRSAFNLLPAELQNSKTLFPPESVLANCEGIAPLDQAASDLFDRYWTELTSA
ncbi:ABC transporter substrate-binding protein [Nodosilinea nodulosa]|uniref:ABC transporter substrate-binding protein n=1 Tax=Nodosilinea nodulosa TaxID=416001 RepID=UPI000474A270|nr:spermidine/putrescine ABC transporter substrate-binding protein [Nodosilinea nodulosa]